MQRELNFRPLYLLVLLILPACSTKRDTLVNRNWHALHTEYNILYNGNLAFEAGRDNLNDGYKDNYWELLPIERLQVSETITLDSEDQDPNFAKAEEKATKAIQLHSMEINDRERNPQMDEAFLLLGKARYFDQRYVPALEAFNYILRKNPTADEINQARIWREKTNIRLENEELALKNLKRLLRFEDLDDQEYSDAQAMMAQAYINLKAPDTAVQHLKLAAANTPRKNERGRYLFITGQLYDLLGFKDSANLAYQQVVRMNRSTPRVYLVNARLGQLRNLEKNAAQKVALAEALDALEANRENRPFLDKIYREQARYHLAYGNDSLALHYYQRSLRTGGQSPELLALNYEDLANYYFDQDQYPLAGAYYDSVLPRVEENSKKYRSVFKKRENLEEVITYEGRLHAADSVLRLVRMDSLERANYFNTYIDSLRALEVARSAARSRKNQQGFAAFGQATGNAGKAGKFYFYNPTTLGYGRTEFRRKWGNRELEDNWRWSQQRTAAGAGPDQAQTGAGNEDALIAEEDRFDLSAYLASVPSAGAVEDSLIRERDFANYQLGLIYKEKFQEYDLAAARLQAVLEAAPEERLLLPAKYNLYRIYLEQESPLAAAMRDNIITEHPGSRYAELLLNPQAQISEGPGGPEARYNELFEKFKAQEYLQVITGSQEQINALAGDPMVAKFELLKANAIGRLQGFAEFREALNYVALNYPNLEEGKKAEYMVAEQLPALESKAFVPASRARGKTPWKLVFPLPRSQRDKALELQQQLQDALADLNYDHTVSMDVYNLELAFVVVHGFERMDFAQGFAELLKINPEYGVDHENFVILSDNYKVIQVHKNLADYRRQLLTPKP